MTVLEQRFMETVPMQLREAAKQQQEIAEQLTRINATLDKLATLLLSTEQERTEDNSIEEEEQ